MVSALTFSVNCKRPRSDIPSQYFAIVLVVLTLDNTYVTISSSINLDNNSKPLSFIQYTRFRPLYEIRS